MKIDGKRLALALRDALAEANMVQWRLAHYYYDPMRNGGTLTCGCELEGHTDERHAWVFSNWQNEAHNKLMEGIGK